MFIYIIEWKYNYHSNLIKNIPESCPLAPDVQKTGFEVLCLHQICEGQHPHSPKTSPGSWFYQPGFTGAETDLGEGGMASLRLCHREGAMAGLELRPAACACPTGPPWRIWGSGASFPGSSHGHSTLWLFDLWQDNLSVLISASGQLNQMLLGNWHVLRRCVGSSPFSPLLEHELLSYNRSSLGSLIPGHFHRGVSFHSLPWGAQWICS